MAQEQLSSGAYLVIQKGALAGKRVELWKECTTIGRSRDSDIFLEDLSVHRKQARILRTPAGFFLHDDHGSGDSCVNDQPVTEQLLSNGDQLRFGNAQMVFYASEGTRPFQLATSRGRELHKKGPAPQESGVARLHFANSRVGLRSVELLPDMTIGRSRECDIFLEDLAVSRLHATIREAPGGAYEIIDNRSASGTFVNGQAVMRCVLHEGDIIQIGEHQFSFQRTRS